ncbi:hypothetical protein [Nannocystis punicea]|uniref:Uncharacterized protein n=1 Tax=Nannocystis punicea TaxID=2995304 RepID=A0ABY7H4R5_9BACT|nr:hypothetical protein [Nannocystis poenicansa]WAS94075.1 hypothetical protein O0S08_48750 [Nannocystis poenicansa]
MKSWRTRRRWAGALVVMLSACGPEKNDSTESSTGSTAGTSSTTVAEPTGTVPTGGTGTGGESESSGGTTGAGGVCGDGPPADAEQQCASQADRASCNGLQLDGGSCVWVAWFPTRLVDGTCEFGDPRGQCAFVPCQEEGCAELSPCGPEGFGGGFIVGENEVVSVGFARWCLGPPDPGQACVFDFEQQLLEGPPECACLCDPGFPGA